MKQWHIVEGRWLDQNEIHREDGPAIKWDDGTTEWWIHNQRIDTHPHFCDYLVYGIAREMMVMLRYWLSLPWMVTRPHGAYAMDDPEEQIHRRLINLADKCEEMGFLKLDYSEGDKQYYVRFNPTLFVDKQGKPDSPIGLIWGCPSTPEGAKVTQ